MNAAAITHPAGRYNPGGTTEHFYAFVDDVLTMPVVADPETATDFASLAVLSTAIVMKTGKQFNKIYCTVEEGEVKTTMVGPRDGKGFENMVEISFPGNTPEILGFQASVANRPCIFIVKEKNGILRVLGGLGDPSYFETLDYSSGKKIADGRANKMTFKDSKATPAPIYTVAMASLLIPAV